MKFADVGVNTFFEFEFSVWQRVPAQGLWNARCGDRWGQFEDDEEVRASTYRPPAGWQGHQ